MPLRNSSDHFGTVAKTFHWSIALLILTLIPLGIVAHEWPYATGEELTVKARLFSLHKTLGLVTFALAVLRILWAVSQPKPGPMYPHRRIETWAAETAHWLLYGSLVAVPLSGWIHHAATTGFAPIWWPFGQSLPFVPKDEGVAALFAGLHWIFNAVLALTLAAHVLGAFKHHLIDRDATLRRMWFGRARLPETLSGHRHAIPFLSALAIWLVALGAGASAGLYLPAKQNGKPAAELAAVQSDWAVADGTLSITVTQLGSEVTGRFAEWTAEIAFDPEIADGVAGTVDVVVAIPSLTLGSVTDQAMGPDFFDAATYPTARFTADILPIVDGYVARGTLTIREASVPVDLPFGLSLDGDTASMTGSLTLDRRDYGIGKNMADETSLRFAVEVDVALTATRTTN